MRLNSLVLILGVLTGASPLASAVQNVEPWLPITTQDLQIKASPAGPAASAVQLYYSYNKDDNSRFISLYRRIKILSDAGREYADGEIKLGPGQSLKEFKGRTIHSDGSIVEFQGQPIEKTIVKARGIKYTARAFALPGVTADSIIEYSYVINLRPHVVDPISEWPLQSELYTLKEHFRFRPFQGFVNVASEWDAVSRKSQSMCSYASQVGYPSPEKKPDGTLELELNNVTAFESEDYMPPKSDYQASVTCYYGGHEFASPDMFWNTWQKRITEGAEKWIGKPSAVHDAAAQAIGSEARTEAKLRLLYARVQQIRNLSFEPERTEKEDERQKLKPNAEAKDVLQHGYGTHWEIDALFAAMARAAGFDASMLGISNRSERSFKRLLLWLGQLDGVAVLVKLDGKDIVLDPGTRFCPYGELPWRYMGTTALNYKSGGDFITTPEPESSPTHRTAKMVLAADGSAKGEISVELTGQDALSHRLEALQTDESGRRKDFESEIQAQLPDGSVVKMVDSQGWESADAPLTARFAVEIPNFASSAGKRLLVPAYFLPTPFKSTFIPSARSYPMNFPFAFTETDELTLQFPQQYTVEVGPDPRKIALSYAAYEISSSLKGNQLVIKRSLRFSGLVFPPEKYDQLRNLFTIIHGGDASQAVLTVGAAAEAAKSQ